MLAVVEPSIDTCADIRLGDYREVLHDVRADMMITSPPYNIGSKAPRQDGRRKQGGYDPKSFGAIRDYADNLPEDEYQHSQIEFLRWAADHLTPDGVLIYNHKPRKRAKRLIHPLRWAFCPEVEQRLVLVEEVWWDRGSTHNHDKSQLWGQTERLYVFRRVDGNYRFDTRILPPEFRSDVWRIPLTNKAGGHACPWPYEMCAAMVEAWSLPGDLVCDPYCGSGRAAAVALQLGRRFVGAEILEKYHALAAETAATPPPLPAAPPPPPRIRPAAPPPRPVVLSQPATPTPIATKVSRAQDQVAAAIAAATAAGVRWRWIGDALETAGLERLSQPDRALLERLAPEIAVRLRAPDLRRPRGAPRAARHRGRADRGHGARRRGDRHLAGRGRPRPRDHGARPARAALARDHQGRHARRAPADDLGDAPLDPHRGQPRLISVYDPDRRITYLFDVVTLGGCPAGLLERRVVGHNLLFDLAMLGAQGVRRRARSIRSRSRRCSCRPDNAASRMWPSSSSGSRCRRRCRSPTGPRRS